MSASAHSAGLVVWTCNHHLFSGGRPSHCHVAASMVCLWGSNSPSHRYFWQRQFRTWPTPAVLCLNPAVPGLPDGADAVTVIDEKGVQHSVLRGELPPEARYQREAVRLTEPMAVWQAAMAACVLTTGAQSSRRCMLVLLA